jgi:hypothetical protein
MNSPSGDWRLGQTHLQWDGFLATRPEHENVYSKLIVTLLGLQDRQCAQQIAPKGDQRAVSGHRKINLSKAKAKLQKMR